MEPVGIYFNLRALRTLKERRMTTIAAAAVPFKTETPLNCKHQIHL